MKFEFYIKKSIALNPKMVAEQTVLPLVICGKVDEKNGVLKTSDGDLKLAPLRLAYLPLYELLGELHKSNKRPPRRPATDKKKIKKKAAKRKGRRKT
jgi:hypothetical protein